MPFDYYARLSRADKKIYDASDAIRTVPLPKGERLGELARAVETTLAKEDRIGTGRASQALVDEIVRLLETEPVKVKVLSRRPASESSVLHGLYVREEDKPAVIRVWMKTNAQKRVVRFRTFLRTLLHEVLHHLDYTYFALEDSFHTEGFFRRESDLLRRVLGEPLRAPKAKPLPEREGELTEEAAASAGSQLDLFG